MWSCIFGACMKSTCVFISLYQPLIHLEWMNILDQMEDQIMGAICCYVISIYMFPF